MKAAPGPTETKLRTLIDLIAKLRSPDGCPWDRSRKRRDIGHYLIEEAYEVLEALETASPQELKEELGDLLFQILFLARMAEESGDFDLGEVIEAITAKMIRRHPHVFGDARVGGVEEVRRNWERIKEEEKPRAGGPASLSGIPRTLSTLAKAQRITARAAKLGFDWPDAPGVIRKLEEEIAEFRTAFDSRNAERIGEEAGDLLFTAVNLCRFAGVDAETALRGALRKFIERFAHIERELAARGKTPAQSSLAEMDRLWDDAKQKGQPPKE